MANALLIGDFEFYRINEKYYDTDAIQKFLVKALKIPLQTSVDSAAIAGMMDLLRTQGCFALSARYAVCFKTGATMDGTIEYPSAVHYDEIAKLFEKALNDMVDTKCLQSLEDISSSNELRGELATMVKSKFMELEASKTLQHAVKSALNALVNFVSMDDESGNLGDFVKATLAAFFDNDLLHR